MNQPDLFAATTPYIHNCYAELSPTVMATALELEGWRAPDLDGPLNYCELGMGFGISLVANAASFPNIRFHGTDLYPGHVDYARRLADDAGLGNVSLFAEGFERTLARTLPPMDFIALHGVYSWVSPQTRQLLVDFVDRHLAPGGVLYVSYNALPGWAPLMPLRRLVYQHNLRTLPLTAPPPERVRVARAFIEELSTRHAAAFAAPVVAAQLARMREVDAGYLLHEYLNPEWHPLYADEVAEEFARAGLEPAGSCDLNECVADLALEPEAAREFGQLQDPRDRLALRDHYLNKRFRRDLFVRGAARLSPGERTARCDDRRWVLAGAPEEVLATTVSSGYAACLNRVPYGALLQALARGAATPASLRAEPALREVDAGALQDALLVMARLGVVQPALPEAAALRARPTTDRFNDVSLARAGADGLGVLVGARTGQATTLTLNERVMRLVQLHREGIADPDALARAWHAQLTAAGYAVRRGGVALVREADQLAQVRDWVSTYLARHAPRLADQGVLWPPSA